MYTITALLPLSISNIPTGQALSWSLICGTQPIGTESELSAMGSQLLAFPSLHFLHYLYLGTTGHSASQTFPAVLLQVLSPLPRRLCPRLPRADSILSLQSQFKHYLFMRISITIIAMPLLLFSLEYFSKAKIFCVLIYFLSFMGKQAASHQLYLKHLEQYQANSRDQ